MLWNVLALSVGLACAGCEPPPINDGARAFSFPSITAPVNESPSGRFSASYTSDSRETDGGPTSRLLVRNLRGSVVAELSFDRSVGGHWSQSDSLFVNNFIGSNLVDCLVMDVDKRQPALVSLLDVLQRARRPGTPAGIVAESPDTAHFYLSCQRWMDENAVAVRISGYTDFELGSGQPFEYQLVYDVRSGGFTRAERIDLAARK